MVLTAFFDRLKKRPVWDGNESENEDGGRVGLDDPADLYYAVEPLKLVIAPLAGDKTGRSAAHLHARLAGRLGIAVETADHALTSSKADNFQPSYLSIATDLGHTWLKRHDADLLVWGEATDNGIWRLRFLGRSVAMQPAGATVTALDRLELPALFDDRHGDMVFACALAAANLESGDALQARSALFEPLMKTVRELAEGDRSGTAAEGATALNCYGALLLLKGAADGDLKTLEKAVSVSQAALIMGGDVFPRHEEATVGARIADALGLISDIKPGTRLPAKTVDYYTTALSMIDRTEFSDEWAALKVRLGLALHGLALADENMSLLQDAADTLTEATSVWSLTDHPARWADIQNSLGGLLLTMAKLGEEPSLYDKALNVFMTIASVCTRTKTPLVWATTLANIGAALKEKGERVHNVALLTKAAEAFREAGAVFNELNLERYVAIVDAQVDEIEQRLNGGSA